MCRFTLKAQRIDEIVRTECECDDDDEIVMSEWCGGDDELDTCNVKTTLSRSNSNVVQ